MPEVRRRILWLRASRARADPVVRQRHLTFVIVGGGPTGVEMAGAIAEVARFALRRDFRRIDPRDATILLLEGSPRLLTSYPPQLSARAKEQLRRLGVDVRTETLVTSIEPGFVHAAGWRIPTETVVWAAGNVASPLLSRWAPARRAGQGGRAAGLLPPDHAKYSCLGDAAAYPHQPGYPLLPGTCPVAIQMGKYAARATRADIERRERGAFRYRDKGQLAVIGRGHAVADLGKVRAEGFIAWLLWIFVHIFFLIGFRNRVVVMFEWAWSYITFQRGARVITDAWQPGGR